MYDDGTKVWHVDHRSDRRRSKDEKQNVCLNIKVKNEVCYRDHFGAVTRGQERKTDHDEDDDDVECII